MEKIDEDLKNSIIRLAAKKYANTALELETPFLIHQHDFIQGVLWAMKFNEILEQIT
jgi:hypothetical protein